MVPLAFSSGASFAALAVFSIVVMIADWPLRKPWRWPPIAVRALGSWIAAIGVLALAFALRPAQ